MGRLLGRSPEDTRRAVLDAAAEVLVVHGPEATLAMIAKAANVSKGGLVYHFASKEELFEALVADLLESFRLLVHAEIEESDEAPGRLARAYIRLILGSDSAEVRKGLGVTAQLVNRPAIAELTRVDAAQWNVELEEDGLPEPIVVLVISAAEGATAAGFWGNERSDATRARLRDDLLQITREASVAAVGGSLRAR